MMCVIFTVCLTIFVANETCNITLGFGADDTCGGVIKLLPMVLFNLVKNLVQNPTAQQCQIKFLLNCGFSKIIQEMLKNPSVEYVHEAVVNVDRHQYGKIHVKTAKQNVRKFDKIIIACSFHQFSKFIQLSKIEYELFSKIRYFDFFSTLVQYENSKTIPQQAHVKGALLLSQQLDNKTILYASHKSILENVPPCSFKKEFKWKMFDDCIGDELNHGSDSVYFIGKEIAGNGIESCLQLCKKLSDMIQ